MASIAGKIISEIGIGALIGTLSAFTSTSSNIYNLLYSITKYTGPNKVYIINTIFKLDIENTIKVTESLLQEISKNNINSMPVLQSIDSIHSIIKTISKELKIIYEKLKYNESLWLASYWRAYDCTSNLERLKTYSEILDKRKRILFEVLQIKHDLITTTNTIKNEFSNKDDSLKYINKIKDECDRNGILLIEDKPTITFLKDDNGNQLESLSITDQ